MRLERALITSGHSSSLPAAQVAVAVRGVRRSRCGRDVPVRYGKAARAHVPAAAQAAARPGGMPACGALRLARNRAASSGKRWSSAGKASCHDAQYRRQGRRRRQTADRVHPTRAAAVPWRERHPAAQVRLPRKAARDNGSACGGGSWRGWTRRRGAATRPTASR